MTKQLTADPNPWVDTPITPAAAETPAERFAGMQLPPHFECDCIPYDGPSHCHRCGDLEGQYVSFVHARCAPLVTSDAYGRMLHLGDHAALLAASEVFDQNNPVDTSEAELTTTPVTNINADCDKE